MLKLRTISIRDYAVLESEQKDRLHPFRHRTHAVRLSIVLLLFRSREALRPGLRRIALPQPPNVK